MFEENREVDRDLVWTFQVLDVVASVELLAQVLAHLVDLGDGFWELDVWLLRILKPD